MQVRVSSHEQREVKEHQSICSACKNVTEGIHDIRIFKRSRGEHRLEALGTNYTAGGKKKILEGTPIASGNVDAAVGHI